jgi:ubiquinone/menaquinone biosynthesis C-methylase UbiE
MLMSNRSHFDILAPGYDAAFTESHTGKAQRLISRKWLLPLVNKPLKILEINCGTGDDACWLANQGHQVIATDQSEAMIAEAKQKTSSAVFHTVAFDALLPTFANQQFDLIFSNFAGLNCVAPAELFVLSSELHALLNPGGHLVTVIFGKYCLWEMAWFLGKGQPKQAGRRWTNKKVMVPLAPGKYQPVYYYSTKKFARLLWPFRLIQKKPVGLLIPPSYMEGAMQKRPRLFQSLVNTEQRSNPSALFSAYADHVLLTFKKETV